MKGKKITARFLALAIAVTSVCGIGYAPSAEAKAKAPALNVKSKKLEVGKRLKLKVKKKGFKVKKTTWKTNRKKVASVTKKGVVTAKAPGSAKITATVKYKKGKKTVVKKLNCKVKVYKSEKQPTQTPPVTVNNPTSAPTTAPTPAPTQAPYYYDYKYFAKYDGDSSENLFIDFVLSDSWQTNTKLSAIESVDLQLDTQKAMDIDVYVSEWDCDINKDDAKKIATISANGSIGQSISLTDEIKGNAAIAALDGTGNGRISFGFTPANGSGQFIIHNMTVNYYNNNTKGISHHEAAISVVTAGIGSASTAYNADKKAAEDAKESFDKVIEDYIAQKPEGIYEALPKDASSAINDYTSMAALTEAKGYKFGTCVTYNLIKNDAEFCKLLAHHCDSITAMNEFKAYSLLDEKATKAAYVNDEDSMPVMKYEKADAICEWAKENGLKIRGHALVWDNAMEEKHRWFFTKEYDQDGTYASNEICRKRLQYYVDQVMRHFQEKYPDVVYCWDVVNEGCDENSGDKLKIRQNRMGQNPFYYHCSSEPNGQGENYIKFTFNCAYDTREAMINEGLLTERGKIELVYNDYNVIESNKRPYVKGIVEMLNEDPNRQLCDSVGAQGYLGAYQKQSGCLSMDWVNKTTTTIKEFSNMNPPVHVQLTEMAMRNFDWDYLDNNQNAEFSHGDFAAKLFEGLANINSETNNSFTSMSMWAFIDDPIMNKVDESFDYWQYAPFSGMFDDVYRVKPAFVNAWNRLNQ